MGRRALRKVRPELDLSQHLLVLEALSSPLQVAALWGRTAPLEVEVGSGKGLFLATAALTHPEHNYLGCEIAWRYAQFAAARLVRQGATHAKLIQGDAQRLLRDYLPEASVQAVHVYFPDPWWKQRHRKRRVLNEAFLMSVHRVLEIGGRLHFWTDVEEYFRATCQLIAARIPLEGPQPVATAVATHDLDYRTHFERRTRLAAQPVFRAEFVKSARPHPTRTCADPGPPSAPDAARSRTAPDPRALDNDR